MSEAHLIKRLATDGPLSAVLSAAVDAVLVIDQSGVIQHASDSVARLFEYQPEECIGRNINMFMPEPDRSAHQSYIEKYLAGGQAKIIGVGRKSTGRKKSGLTFPMHLSVGQFEFDGIHYFVGICHDLTEYTDVVMQLREAEKRYKNIVENQKHFICRVDQNLKVTFANTSFVKALGLSHAEVVGSDLAAIVSEGTQCLKTTISPLFADSEIDEVNVKIMMRPNETGAISEWSFRKIEGDDRDDEIQGFGVDVSAKEAAMMQAAYLRDHDQLTGLLNSRALVEKLQQTARPGQLFAGIHVDIDRFGQINQRYGYTVGDSALVEMSRRAKGFLPKAALIARAEGDGFFVACEVSDQGEAGSMARGLLKAMAQPYEINGQLHVLESKSGVAFFPIDHHEISKLSELAEAALRDAKVHGEPVVFFSEQSRERLLRQIIVEQELKEALKHQTIEVYLQPKVCLSTLRTHSFEALARWNHHELGQISPGEFVPLAGAAGLAPELDHYIIKQVAGLISEMSAIGKACLPIAVNIVANHFSNETFFEKISGILETYGISPTAIELEITEGAILDLTTNVSETMRRLRSLGMRISIDDFGTGYSSLSYLKQLDVDELKIDKSFIDDIEAPEGHQLVDAVISLAKAFGLLVTAEGVETHKQAELLTNMGCDLVQGYYFSRPLPAKEAFLNDMTLTPY